jgi:thioredoxin reductase
MRRVVWIAGAIVIALVGVMLASRSSYQPGPLMIQHAKLTGQCASCHRPWRGVAVDRCVACHGDITDTNPHGGYDVTSADSGLVAGKTLLVDADNDLICLSCHSEHAGRRVDLNATATFACTWCHKHVANDQVPEHTTAVMSRRAAAINTFVQPFNHHQHQLLIESHYPPIAAGFACASCHSVTPTAPPHADRMSFRWSSCSGNGCHMAPQDSFLQLPAALGTAPLELPYSARVLHMNAVFTHSRGHLVTPCVQCHTEMAASVAPGDDHALVVEQCFKCHAHQPGRAAIAVHSADAGIGLPGVSVAFAAADAGEASDAAPRVTACGDCHLFHTHGPVPSHDFSRTAPLALPGAPAHLAWTLYLPGVSRVKGVPAVRMHAIRFAPWLFGFFGLIVAALCAIGFVRVLPAPPVEAEVVTAVAPQRLGQVPLIDDTYQTNVRHLYIVGEASGTASINLAMRSGRQVIEAIAAELKAHPERQAAPEYEVVIVGCGPAGLGATATAKTMGLKYVTLERMTPASTLRAYPRAKFVQATPIDIAEYGSFFLEGDNSREELILEWERIIATLDLQINDREEVVDVTSDADLLTVRTARGNLYHGRTVVLAVGVRGNPRHLGLPGEEAARVHYTLIEPGEFRDRKILVVGGGNAGAEVAQALARADLGNQVAYSFHASVLGNVTRENAERLSALQQTGGLTVYPATALKEIRPHTVVLEPIADRDSPAAGVGGAAPIEIDNEIIFAMIGAELPNNFFRKLGIRMVRKGRFGSG